MNETLIYCKSDCQFSQNPERVCRLKQIQLVQVSKFEPQLICSQYVATQVSQQRYNLVDMEKSMDFGMDKVIKERLSKDA